MSSRRLPTSSKAPRPPASELLARRLATDSLIDFSIYTNPNYSAQPHHRMIADRLMALERGDVKRLIVLSPPRHGKSELVSKNFVAWALGRNPKHQIISASYNQHLAKHFGRQVRNLIATPEFANLFPGLQLSANVKAADAWQTKQGGIYVAFGVGGGSGFGADIFVLDDPIKTRVEADSDALREHVWDWFASTAYTRLMPEGRIVICYTPWHEDDLGGRLQAIMNEGGEHWEVLRLPAIAEVGDPLSRRPGDPLWPERYHAPELERIRDAIGPREWQALYCCHPVPDTGDYFKREWFKYYDEKDLPGSPRFYGSSDFALAEHERADFTCHIVAAVDDNSNIYLVDLWRDKKTPQVTVAAQIDMAIQHNVIAWIDEKLQMERALAPFIERTMRERNCYFRRMVYARLGDKVANARSFQARLQQHRVFLPKAKHWLPQLIAELMGFPAAKHDDQVDALAGFGHLLNQIARPRVHGNYQARLDFNPFGWGGKPLGFR